MGGACAFCYHQGHHAWQRAAAAGPETSAGSLPGRFGGAGAHATWELARPSSAPGEYRQYTATATAILEGTDSGSWGEVEGEGWSGEGSPDSGRSAGPAAWRQQDPPQHPARCHSAGVQTGASLELVPGCLPRASSPVQNAVDTCLPALPATSAMGLPGGQQTGWSAVRYSQLHQAGAEEIEEEGEEERRLTDEPSAPPMYNEPWATEGCLDSDAPLGHSSPAAAKTVRFAEGSGGQGDGSRSGAGADGGPASSPWSPSSQPACHGNSWGAAAAVCGAALTGGVLRWSSETCCSQGDGQAGSSSPSRQISEETARFQRLLDTLAARRREAAIAVGSRSPPDSRPPSCIRGEARTYVAAMSASGAAGERSAAVCGISGSGGAAWPDVTLPCAAPRQPEAGQWQTGWALHLSPAGDAAEQQRLLPLTLPVSAPWPGMSTFLGNLRKAAEVQPRPQGGFWDQPVTEDDEAVGVPAAESLGSSAHWVSGGWNDGSSWEGWAAAEQHWSPPGRSMMAGATAGGLAREVHDAGSHGVGMANEPWAPPPGCSSPSPPRDLGLPSSPTRSPTVTLGSSRGLTRPAPPAIKVPSSPPPGLVSACSPLGKMHAAR